MITEPHLSSFFKLISLFFAFSDSISIFSEIASHFFMNQIINKARKIKPSTNEVELNSDNIYVTKGNYFSIKFLMGGYSISSKFTVS
jgi:hypothetical protein